MKYDHGNNLKLLKIYIFKVDIKCLKFLKILENSLFKTS